MMMMITMSMKSSLVVKKLSYRRSGGFYQPDELLKRNAIFNLLTNLSAEVITTRGENDRKVTGPVGQKGADQVMEFASTIASSDALPELHHHLTRRPLPTALGLANNNQVHSA
jgi:hypothetical protein